MDDTFFFVWRRLLETDEWLAEKFTRGQAWVDLIGLANWADGTMTIRGRTVEVKRGQVGWSQLALARRWKWNRGAVSRMLNEWENRQRIVQHSNTVLTVIEIVNFEGHQATLRAPKNDAPETPQFSEDVERMLAFFCKELGVDPKGVRGNEDWRNVFRLMIEHSEKAKRKDRHEMCQVIRWVAQDVATPSGGNDWRGWRAQIRSPGNFRKHYEKLLERSKAPAKGRAPELRATLTPDMLENGL